MMMVGYDILGANGVMEPSIPSLNAVQYVSVTNVLADKLRFSNGTETYKNKGDTVWTTNTILNANFNGNLMGGDIEYAVDTISKIRLKRREKGGSWLTIYEKTVNGAEDMTFTYYDEIARGRGAVYEYAISPVVGVMEQSMTTVSCVSEFDGAVITDGETSYHILLEPSVTQTARTRPCTVIQTMNGKYPFVFYNGDTNYDSGTFSGVVIEYDNETDTFDFDGGDAYRRKFLDWLLDGNSKILKMYDGRIWMIAVSGEAAQSSEEHYDKVTISFPFVEVGSVESSNDLYDNGFINCNVEGR